MKEQITYKDFEKIDIRLGTVISVEKNEKARKPSLVLKVDLPFDEAKLYAEMQHHHHEMNNL